MNDVKVRFLHPSDGNSIAVSIPEGVKVKEGVNQLIRNGFLPKCKEGYLLSCHQGQLLDMEDVFSERALSDGDAITIQLKSDGNAASDDLPDHNTLEEKPQAVTFSETYQPQTSNNESLEEIWAAVRQLEEKQNNTFQVIEHLKNQGTAYKSVESYEDINTIIKDLKKMGGVKTPRVSILNRTAYWQLFVAACLGGACYLFNSSSVAMNWLYQLVI